MEKQINGSETHVIEKETNENNETKLLETCYFVTSITRYRIPFFLVSLFREVLIRGINYYRERLGFKLFGYVVMPDHIHILMSPASNESESTISTIVRDIKSYSGREISRILGDRGQVWEQGFVKKEVQLMQEFEKILELMHENPVRRGLVRNPNDYPYSSYRYYANGEVGAIALDKITNKIEDILV